MKEARSREREDWTSMRWSDWMTMSPSEWMNRALPGWDMSYGDWMSTPPTEWWARMSAPGAVPGQWPSRGREQQHRDRHHHHHHHHRHHECRCHECHGEDEDCREEHREEHDEEHHEWHHRHGCCRRCSPEPCECRCCIGDVDLAVYSRLGEQRVIPIVVANERRRDKAITLELSEWRTRGGKASPVTTVALAPTQFSLPACGEQKVTLEVKIAGTTAGGQSAGGASAGAQPAGGATTNVQVVPPEPVEDVDECLVAFADLRLVGCDHRSLRLAIAILPRDCDPYQVGCGCTCC